MIPMRVLSLIAGTLFSVLLPFAVHAAPVVADPSQPVYFTADAIAYDEHNQRVVASGNVQATQGERILLSDRVIYDQKTDAITAEGNVSLAEPTGEVYFSDSVELRDQMKKGLIDQFKARLKDNSLLAAQVAERVDENNFILENAVYSPCKVCKKDPDKAPQWQMRASRVALSEEEQTVRYKNARFEVYGVPVFYTPYLSHPMPGADRKSGFLMPVLRNVSTLGTTIQTPYYWNIAPNMDATIAPIFTNEEGNILTGEFRRLTRQGKYTLSGSITNPDKFDESGNRIDGQEIRGHFEAHGQFAITPEWQWGFDGKRASDDTYLRRYEFSNEDSLSATLYANRIKGNNYTDVRTLAFQGLRAEDDPATTPFVLPLVTSHVESTPAADGSKWLADANIMSLTRDEGARSRRLSVSGGWYKPYITQSGQVFGFTARMRGDAYAVQDVLLSNGSVDDEATAGRLLPEVQLDWSLPLMRRYQEYRMFLSPIANVIIGPYGGNPDEIPNEDSLDLELSDDNLFGSQRFTGYDRIEEGPRFNYGVRGALEKSDMVFSALLGQSYRVKEDPLLTPQSGMEDNVSDYVGRLGFSKGKMFEAAYRFRYNKEDLSPNRSEIFSSVYFSPVRFSLDYLVIDDVSASVINNREEVAGDVNVEITRQWSVSANARRDLTNDGGWVNTGGSLNYLGDCSGLRLLLLREYTRDRDIEPATSLTLQFSLKNLN